MDLRTFRKSVGMSIQAVADAVDCHKSTLSRIERYAAAGYLPGEELRQRLEEWAAKVRAERHLPAAHYRLTWPRSA